MVQPPPHPGVLLAECIKQSKLSMSEFSRRLGVSRVAVNNIVIGRSGVSPIMALRLEKLLGDAAVHWLNRQQEYDLYHARIECTDQIESILKWNKPV